jgi:hypothetical protein
VESFELETEEEAKEFVRQYAITRVMEGPKDININSVRKLAAVSKIDGVRLVVRSSLDRMSKDLDNMSKDIGDVQGFVKNTATSLELTTNVAIVGNETLREKFGELKLINGGKGVLVKNKETGREFDIDGLIKNKVVILLNETKSRLHPDDVGTILERKKSLETAIMDPDAYTTTPDGVLYELAGLRVVAIASTNGCAKNAKEVCAAEGIHVVEPDGSGYKVTIHNKPPVA